MGAILVSILLLSTVVDVFKGTIKHSTTIIEVIFIIVKYNIVQLNSNSTIILDYSLMSTNFIRVTHQSSCTM